MEPARPHKLHKLTCTSHPDFSFQPDPEFPLSFLRTHRKDAWASEPGSSLCLYHSYHDLAGFLPASSSTLSFSPRAMALVPSTASSRWNAELRLAQAVSQFEADLTSDQKAAFNKQRLYRRTNPPDSSDVMRLTAEIDRQAAQKGRGVRCFGPRLTNVLQAVKQFASIGDVLVGGSQNIVACGVWTAVRMSLLVCIPEPGPIGFCS